MRKLLSLLLSFIIIFSIIGCKKLPSEVTHVPQITTAPSTEETTQPTNIDEIQQKPMYAISLMPYIDETTDGNNKVRFIYAYQNLSLVLPEPEIADKIILEHLNRIDKADQYADSLRAESLLEEYNNVDAPFMYYISYVPKRFDNAILSIHEDTILQTGGIHPNTYGHFYNYDLLSGNALKLSDILTDKITAEHLADTVIGSLSCMDGLFESYKDTINNMFKGGLEEYKHWYFSENGLCFHFDPYVLASYATGPITAELSYSQLTGVLKDEYFPSERDSYKGQLVAEEFTAATQAEYTQFAEVILAEGGAKILLSADGLIMDVRVDTVETESDRTTTVMAAQSLSPGDALMVEFDPAMTKLFVSYNSGEKTETKTITYINKSITIS